MDHEQMEIRPVPAAAGGAGSDDGNGFSRRSFLVGSIAAAGGVLAAPRTLAQSIGSGAGAAGRSDDELAWMPGWQLQKLFAERALSPLEYARFLLARVEKHGELGAFISVFPELLLEQAEVATQQMMRGGDLPLLHGLPVSIKDTVFTKGQRTTLGSLLFEDHVPDKDSVAAERVRQAGGLIFAKSNTPEFAMNRRTLNLVAREAVNPWDLQRSSGGSSGGAGVAAAAGLGPLAVGTDGGGSIRIPSSFNGVFGLLPSRGRVPNGAGFYNTGTSGIGPMTRDVRDAAMLLQVMACVDRRDALSLSTQPPDYLRELDKGVKGIRMAWSGDLGRVVAEEAAVVELCHDAARSFAKLGAVYSEPDVRLEDPHDLLEPDPEYSRPQMEAYFRKAVPGYRNVMEWAATLPREDYAKLAVYFRNRDVHPNEVDYAMSIPPSVRYRARTRVTDLFKEVDLLMSPVIGRTAFRFTDTGITPWQYTAYTFLASATGYCAASIPVGFIDGLPVGLQIMGRPDEESLVLRAARALERERPWAQHRPQLA